MLTHTAPLPPGRLTELGLVKLVNEVDMKEAARAGLLGLGSKPLTSDNIEKHLTDFGLDPEFGVHSRIRGLSGARPCVAALRLWCSRRVWRARMCQVLRRARDCCPLTLAPRAIGPPGH